MSEELFDVVFFGILQAGKDKETVMQNMAALFKTDAAKLAPYFAGGRKVIKAKINTAAAEKYKTALENVGLSIKLEPCTMTDQAPAASTREANTTEQTEANANIDTSEFSVAPVGSDVLTQPVAIPAQKIEDISDISMAETGADIIQHPTPTQAQKIEDTSNLSMAEVGSSVLEHSPEIIPQTIEDISGISMAEAGADIIENPKPKEPAKIADFSALSLEDEKS